MLTDDQLNHFHAHGFIILDGIIPHQVAEEISSSIDKLACNQELKQASIGKAHLNQINTTERGDFIQWIDPLDCTSPVNSALQQLAELRQCLNRNFYLGLRDFECHLTQYPAGTCYKRHSDRHKNGSSRCVSVVLYLTPDWCEGQGGELILYQEEKSTTIQPVFGRLALFLSEMEHEVLPTHINRKSLTGWMLNETII
jgi:SM-20-related protein